MAAAATGGIPKRSRVEDAQKRGAEVVFPPNLPFIVGYEKYQRKKGASGEPQTVQLIGERHNQFTDAEVDGLVELLKQKLSQDEKAKVYIEGHETYFLKDAPFPKGRTLRTPDGKLVRQFNRLPEIYRKFQDEPEFKHRVEIFDDRANPLNYLPHRDLIKLFYNDFMTYNDYFIDSYPKEVRDKAYSWMFHNYRTPMLEKYPSYNRIFDRYVPPKGRVGEEITFTAPILDSQMLDIIEEGKEGKENPIFYVGDMHREAIGKTLAYDTQGRWEQRERKVNNQNVLPDDDYSKEYKIFAPPHYSEMPIFDPTTLNPTGGYVPSGVGSFKRDLVYPEGVERDLEMDMTVL